jgi:hypothetical protein
VDGTLAGKRKPFLAVKGKTVSPIQGFRQTNVGIARGEGFTFAPCSIFGPEQRWRARLSQEAFCRQEEDQH